MRKIILVAIVMLVGLIAPAPSPSDSRYFAATGHMVSGKFLAYWNAHGGLAQQGYPISAPLQEVSDLDGKTYTVQYFERAEFELHPENQPPNDVLLSQLGRFRLKQLYGDKPLANGQPGGNNLYFAATGHSIEGKFRDYWLAHGGLVQQGYPLSERLHEVSALDGKSYTVQYFERAVFELHSENKPPNDVLLTQLGTLRYRDKYQSTPTPTPSPSATSTPISTPTVIPLTPTPALDPSLVPDIQIAQPQLKRGEYQTITVTTKPAARVTIVCTYPSGDQSSNGCSKLFVGGPQQADAQGRVVIRWHVGATTHPGHVLVAVKVELDGAIGVGQAGFDIV